MKYIISLFIKHPIWANSIIIVTILFGYYSFSNINKAFFPEREPTKIQISSTYLGASPEEMEEGITVKIEEAIRGISEIEEFSSKSKENISTVQVQAYQGVDMTELLADVKNAVDKISSWPVEAENPIIYKQKTSSASSRAAFMSLTGTDNLFELKEKAEQIEREMLNSGIVSEISILGLPIQEFSIEIKENQLIKFGIKFDEIVNAIKFNNIDISSGTIKTNEEEFLIRTKAKKNKASEIEKIVLRTNNNGDYITIGDVADVKFQFSDIPNKSFLDEKRSVTFEIKRNYNQNLEEIAEYLDQYVKEFNKKNSSLQLIITYNFYEMLKSRIDLLMKNGLLGLVFVLITLGLFLNIRLALWVAFGIPFSFLGLFILGSFFGMTINMISLFGMILVVGILVDDGIVIAENIFQHFEQGKTPYRATIDGTLEVIPSVFSSVLTTIIAFSMLLFIEGLEILMEMAFVVIASLSFSLIEAFLILPSHLSHKKVLKTNVIGKFRKKASYIIYFFRDKVYKSILKLALKYYRIGVLLPVGFIIVVLYLLTNSHIKSTYFPSIPFDEFAIEVCFKPGEREEKTEKFLKYCLSKINIVKDELKEKYNDDIITHTTLNIGSTRTLGENGSHTGHINISLFLEKYNISSFSIIEMIREKIGKVKEAEKFIIGGTNRWGKPISIALKHNDSKILTKASNFFKQKMNQIPDIKEIQDNSASGNREIIVNLKPKAYLLGLNQNIITRQIRQGFYGEQAQRIIIGTDEVKIWVRYPDSDKRTIYQLENIKIKTNQNQEIPLSELVNFEIKRGITTINRFNGLREIKIEAAQKDAYESTPMILNKIKKSIMPEFTKRFPNVNIEYRGQRKNATKSMNSMKILLIIMIFLMILTLTINFNSLYQSLLIFIVIPAGICGSILGHGIENEPVSILSAWGMIALMGVIINDAVVFLQKYNLILKEDKEIKIKEAVFKAGILRFRPIIITSLTTVAGLYPLILEKSFQAKFLIPMAISVAYGVLFGTFFILVFFPCLILFGNDVKIFFNWIWTGNKKSRRDVETVTIQIKNEIEDEM